MRATEGGANGREPVLSVVGVSKRYGPIQALSETSLTFRVGEAHAIAGQNGAGKSTFVRILSGATRPTAGAMRLRGVPVEFSTPQDAQRAGIVTIYQELSLVPGLSVAENIFLGDIAAHRRLVINWRQIRAQAKAALEWLRFDIDVDLPVSALTVAQQQGVELAKALHRKAKVILLDEPTATLPAPDVKRLLSILRTLRGEGIAIIYISHRLEELYELCDRVSVFRDGRLVTTHDLPATPPAEIVRAMIGRALRTSLLGRSLEASGKHPRVGTGNVGETVLSVRNLSDRAILHDISFDLRRGEVVGIAGLVGSGQSELAGCLFGARVYTRGRIRISGKLARLEDPREAIRLRIGLLPQDRKTQGLIHHMSVAQNVSMANLRRFTRNGVLRTDEENRVARALIQQLGMRNVTPDVAAGTLSGGTQQKVVLAKWLVSTASILIFDEPTRGIDVGAKEEIYELIGKFVGEGGSVIMFSSELSEVMMADRILVMVRGRVVAELEHDAVDPQGEAILERMYQGAGEKVSESRHQPGQE
jgi:ribose transport system ATP-binding protein